MTCRAIYHAPLLCGAVMTLMLSLQCNHCDAFTFTSTAQPTISFKPAQLVTTTFIAQKSSSSSQLHMGVMEDFLAGTDKETRKKENESYLAQLNKRVERINSLEPTIEDLDDDELVAKTEEFRKRLVEQGEDINGPILEEAFAVVREAAWYVFQLCYVG